MRRVLVSAAVTAVVGASGLALSAPTAAQAGPASASTAPVAVCDATTCTTTFVETGDVQIFTVPSFVNSVQATVAGARGGNSLVEGEAVHAGGLGGMSSASITVSPDTTLSVVVGGAGGDTDASYISAPTGHGGHGGGGVGGAGSGGEGAAGGGGGSFLFGSDGSALLVAGGGGGAPAAGAHDGNTHNGGVGGAAGVDASAGDDGDHGASGGQPATPDASGDGGDPASVTGSEPGSPGSPTMTLTPTALPVGGAGGTSDNPGGGGGGGYQAGGGGGGDGTDGNGNGGGGGGGAGFAAGPSVVTSVTGSAGVRDGNGEVTISYAKQAQPAVTISSTAPAHPVVGQAYVVAAHGGNFGTGNPIVISIDSATASDCTVSGSTVTLTHTGSCTIDADQAGDTAFQPAPLASQTLTVGKATTKTVAAVQPTTITATVQPVSPSSAVTPTGSVTFSVGGIAVDSPVSLVNGVATLTHSMPTSAAQHVSAVYSGDDGFAGSTGTVTRASPRVTATVSSTKAKNKAGWYRFPVTVTFHCTATSAPLASGCPSPVTLTKSAAHQSVSRTVRATDGGAATATASGISIDSVAPSVTVKGVVSGHRYKTGRHLTCVARDKLSGLAHPCQLVQQQASKHRVTTVTYIATASDRAGNVTTRTGEYLIKP